ncbi:hypothetical protein IQ250_23240 [Pseudanabaenaceae cyanobacterium LEGE 13415]|nr:hypothetical protein [Pseudanabaenaceae cyanobacterium LEGE 13415]
MTPSLLRQVWAVVEATQAAHILNLDDAHLVQAVLGQFHPNPPLNPEETRQISNYLYSRLTLIRDLASDRLAVSV